MSIYRIINVVEVTIQQLNKDTSFTTILTLALVISTWRIKQDLPFFISVQNFLLPNDHYQYQTTLLARYRT